MFINREPKDNDIDKILQVIGKYYDIDALSYDYRIKKNYISTRMRMEFRRLTEKFPFKTALDLGFGTGRDLVYFARKYPDRKFYGIDASEKMVKITQRKIKKLGLKNVIVKKGYIERVDEEFPNTKFDMIYSYFGVMNSVINLENTVRKLRKIISPKGTLLITVVNKMYMIDYLLNLFLLRPKKAFARAKGTWWGYSPSKKIPTRFLTIRDIKKIFSPYFKLIYRRGFCILYPAWYYNKIYMKITGPFSKLDRLLWNLDKYLNLTPLWGFGEYALYIFKPI